MLLPATPEEEEKEAEAHTSSALPGRGHADGRVRRHGPGQLQVLQSEPNVELVPHHTNSASSPAEELLSSPGSQVFLSRGPAVSRHREVIKRLSEMFSLQHFTKEREPSLQAGHEVSLTVPLPWTWLHHSQVPEVPEVPEVTKVGLATSSAVSSHTESDDGGADGQLGTAGQQEEAGLAGQQAEAGPSQEREEDLKLPGAPR